MLCVYVSTSFILYPLLLYYGCETSDLGFGLYGYRLVIQTAEEVSLPMLVASCLQKLAQTSSANSCYLEHNNGRSFCI